MQSSVSANPKAHSLRWSDHHLSINYVASKIHFSAHATTFNTERHINVNATLRIRLLPLVSDGEPNTGPWMEDSRLREKLVCQFRHPRP